METLYICGDADIARDENTILVRIDGRKKRLPIETVRHIVMTADGTVTTKFLALCGRAGVRVSFFDHYGWFKGAFEPAVNVGAGEVTIRQAALFLEPERRMALAREIVRAALHNIVVGLRYYAYRGQDGLRQPIREILRCQGRLEKAPDPESLMGLEGMARRFYYEAWGLVDERLAFAPRVKRPPNNRINCLISFLNGLTYTAIRHEIAKTHLDETLSVLHAPSAGRSSLSLDLAEPFKPVVVDRQIFAMVRKAMPRDEWFDEHDGICLLTEAGRRAVVERFTTAVDSVTGEYSLRTLMRKEALKLQRHVLGIEDYAAFRRGS
ncbi:CRISPR-associated endonuclease Cas1 [Telmatospirillum sp. J64-1]|uniref:CRISPR-associated endonuclease Cas1 n=1 Tax=Telmatospirillum sp. J64-1 TaxID=2502183 RepID=UPI00115E7184|nr:CRISPR-associated endonuclease Cas1 [Telmatospirillum sp. J64-1]